MSTDADDNVMPFGIDDERAALDAWLSLFRDAVQHHTAVAPSARMRAFLNSCVALAEAKQSELHTGAEIRVNGKTVALAHNVRIGRRRST